MKFTKELLPIVSWREISFNFTLNAIWTNVLNYYRERVSIPLSVSFFFKKNMITGEQLHQILLEKWGYSYDVQLRKIKGKIFVQVMWKYLEQASFPLSPQEYAENLNAIANYLNAWNGVEQLQSFIEKTRERPRLGKAVSIQLDLGERSSEWILDDA